MAAAVELFGQHGVGGTSLQMIADAVGVTKAAIYFQFRTKFEIVLGVATTELAWLEAAVDEAEAEQCDVTAREMVLSRMIDLTIERRGLVGMLQTDPVIVEFLADYEPFHRVMDRLFAVLETGDSTGTPEVPAAMLMAAIGGAAAHPLVANFDNATLRSHLMHLAQRLFRLPG
ncbi:TetR/AcrR family transcriptional regulator; helix-turn-helix transcriptional regulator [Nocardia sp. CA2R105]|nr:TetR/AcrR family transcriptional regulator; helix-turn-helix transcriptional regulator [Nocardia coffeae]